MSGPIFKGGKVYLKNNVNIEGDMWLHLIYKRLGRYMIFPMRLQLITHPWNYITAKNIDSFFHDFGISDIDSVRLVDYSNTDHNNRLAVFAKNESKFSDDELNEFLEILGGDYAQIGDESKRATLDINSLNETLLKILERRTFISSYKEDKKKFRVFHKIARSEE
ncbi:hypothetical protein [Rhizosphaericola mali]|uniref:Uncharacterized protein n=1 Tax=Rhizosphaericola mali TaxID=2545455 RepID=A0A5P2G970_9BACT|nr:hypothetical protein [Rhizosphaericola mali]QES88071.1 hypothetical protein E0W69_005125 [Rhizosphaericola mali]